VSKQTALHRRHDFHLLITKAHVPATLAYYVLHPKQLKAIIKAAHLPEHVKTAMIMFYVKGSTDEEIKTAIEMDSFQPIVEGRRELRRLFIELHQDGDEALIRWSEILTGKAVKVKEMPFKSRQVRKRAKPSRPAGIPRDRVIEVFARIMARNPTSRIGEVIDKCNEDLNLLAGKNHWRVRPRGAKGYLRHIADARTMIGQVARGHRAWIADRDKYLEACAALGVAPVGVAA